MESMQNDMTTVWDSFTVEVNAHIERVDGAVTRAFDRVIRTALSTGDVNAEARAGNDTLSAMRTLGATLGHRKDLVLYEIEKASEKFETDLSSLHTDAFSSIRTAFIGKLLEATYHAANMDYGKSTPSPLAFSLQ